MDIVIFLVVAGLLALGGTCAMIWQYALYGRQLLLIGEAKSGQRPLMVLDAKSAPKITGPAAIDGIGPTADWQGYWRKTDASKRKAAAWTNGQ